MAPPSSVPSLLATIERRQRAAAPGAFVGVELPDDFDVSSLIDGAAGVRPVGSIEQPANRRQLAGFGTAKEVVLRRREGPAAARGAVRRAMAVSWEADHASLRPRMLGGFRFDPSRVPEEHWSAFGYGRLTLPHLLFVGDGPFRGVVIAPGVEISDIEPYVSAGLNCADVAEPMVAHLRVSDDVDESHWCRSVESTAAEVRQGLYEKAVLATPVVVSGAEDIDLRGVLARLRARYPQCHVFTFSAGDGTFVGASPETLVELHDRKVRALGLAGSARRGDSEEEDEEIGRALMASAKDRIEHETVVRAIRQHLEGATDELLAPNAPMLRKLPNIQHLSTDITATARAGVDVLELVRRLHPTPAVCGWPRDVATDVIARREHFDRGWYAGPIGWIDARGEGEFVVALRSALVSGSTARLFAGNGIMGDSDPRLELEEVRLKLRPLMEALSGTAPA